MGVTVSEFGKNKEGKVVSLYTIENENGMVAKVTDFGAILVELWVRNSKDELIDVVLGFDNAEQYLDDGNNFGATVGPIANRTANAKTTIDGVEYTLEVNDAGVNNLHTSFYGGYQKQLWNATVLDDENAVEFSLERPDMDLGLPGNRKVTVTYTLTDEDEVVIEYTGTSDKNTLINMTNHTYFNLSGHDSGNILKEELVLNASNFTETQPGAIPTGNIIPVEGTPLDFYEAHEIGERILEDNDQLKAVNGYDHNFVVDDYDGEMGLIATLIDNNSGIVMDTYTDLPGVQLYSANWVNGEKGKNGAVYGKWQGVCLETQFFPNSANEPNFETPLFGPDKEYRSTTIYQFSCLAGMEL